MTRTNILNAIIERYRFTRYLEIGLSHGKNFEAIQCDYKVSIDPDPACHATYKMTSDSFFRLLPTKAGLFDVVFIDGLHEAPQVERDINNALEIIPDNGFIVCHDCSPSKEIIQRVPRVTREWTGDVWKAIVRLRQRPDISIHTVDTDYGCGIIQKKANHSPFTLTRELTFENLDNHRQIWLNLITPEQFTEKFL